MSKSEEKSPVVFIQDALRRNVEKETKGNVTVLYDDTGRPSYMMRIPKFNVETVDSSLGRGVHPAFIVDGKEVDEIFIGCKNAQIIDGRAYSIPDESATRNVTFDAAREACTKKGKGWHLLSAWEYAALAMWAVKNHPKYFDKDYWEWVDGMKIVGGKIFIHKDNHFELPENDWPYMGICFDDVGGKPLLRKEVTHYTEPEPKGVEDERYGDYTLCELSEMEYFVSPEASPSDFSKQELETLGQLLLIPSATPIIAEIDNTVYVRNYGERLPLRGGSRGHGAAAGLGALRLNYRRSTSGSYVGFRPAFIGI